MSVEVNWDESGCTTIRLNFSEEWTWTEMLEGFGTAAEMTLDCPDTIHFLCWFAPDTRQSIDLNTTALSYLNMIVRDIELNNGLTVFVNAGLFVRLIYNVAVRVHPSIKGKIKFLNSLEGAREFIGQQPQGYVTIFTD